MKVIRIGKSIVSLENVREVEIQKLGTGAQRNPRISRIIISYQAQCEHTSVSINDIDGYPKGEKCMEQIFQILSRE
jgi:hypothetical protein